MIPQRSADTADYDKGALWRPCLACDLTISDEAYLRVAFSHAWYSARVTVPSLSASIVAKLDLMAASASPSLRLIEPSALVSRRRIASPRLDVLFEDASVPPRPVSMLAFAAL